MNAAGHSDKTQANMRMLEEGDLVVKGQRLSELFVCARVLRKVELASDASTYLATGVSKPCVKE